MSFDALIYIVLTYTMVKEQMPVVNQELPVYGVIKLSGPLTNFNLK